MIGRTAGAVAFDRHPRTVQGGVWQRMLAGVHFPGATRWLAKVRLNQVLV